MDDIQANDVCNVKEAISRFTSDYPSHATWINKYIKKALSLNRIKETLPLNQIHIPIDKYSETSQERILDAVQKLSLYIAAENLMFSVSRMLAAKKKVSLPLLRAASISVLIHYLGRQAFPFTLTEDMIVSRRGEQNKVFEDVRQCLLVAYGKQYNLMGDYRIFDAYKKHKKMYKTQRILSIRRISDEKPNVRGIFYSLQKEVLQIIVGNTINMATFEKGQKYAGNND